MSPSTFPARNRTRNTELSHRAQCIALLDLRALTNPSRTRRQPGGRGCHADMDLADPKHRCSHELIRPGRRHRFFPSHSLSRTPCRRCSRWRQLRPSRGSRLAPLRNFGRSVRHSGRSHRCRARQSATPRLIARIEWPG